MKYLLIAFFTLFIGLCASAQSPFKSEPKPAARLELRLGATVQPDSIVNAWRFTANFAAYGYSFNGTSSALSGGEFGYEHQSYNYATQTLTVIWSVNAAWFPINSALPISGLQSFETLGLTFGFHNPFPVGNSEIQIGPSFNPNAPKNQQFGILATIGILLN